MVPPDLKGQAQSTFSFHVIAALAALVLLGAGAFFSSGYSRATILAGLASSAVAYFAKKS